MRTVSFGTDAQTPATVLPQGMSWSLFLHLHNGTLVDATAMAYTAYAACMHVAASISGPWTASAGIAY